AESSQVRVSAIVELWNASMVARVALGYEDRHTLPSACQQDAVGIHEVSPSFWLHHVVPLAAPKLVTSPVAIDESKIRVPSDTGPVKFEPLYLELRCSVFQIGRGSRITWGAKKVVYRVNVDANVNGVRLQAHGL